MGVREWSLRVSLNHRILKCIDHRLFGADGAEVLLENLAAEPDMFARTWGMLPISLHSVTIFPTYECASDKHLLLKARHTIEYYRPAAFSFHLGKGTLAGIEVERLIPIVYDYRQLAESVYSVAKIQDQLGTKVLLENISEYFVQPGSVMNAAQFMLELVQRTNCGVLLDVTNLYINCRNFSQAGGSFCDLLSAGVVEEIHVAGHSISDGFLIDSHSADITEECEQLLKDILGRCGPLVVTLERDLNIGDGTPVEREIDRLRRILSQIDDAN